MTAPTMPAKQLHDQDATGNATGHRSTTTRRSSSNRRLVSKDKSLSRESFGSNESACRSRADREYPQDVLGNDSSNKWTPQRTRSGREGLQGGGARRDGQQTRRSSSSRQLMENEEASAKSSIKQRPRRSRSTGAPLLVDKDSKSGRQRRRSRSSGRSLNVSGGADLPIIRTSTTLSRRLSHHNLMREEYHSSPSSSERGKTDTDNISKLSGHNSRWVHALPDAVVKLGSTGNPFAENKRRSFPNRTKSLDAASILEALSNHCKELVPDSVQQGSPDKTARNTGRLRRRSVAELDAQAEASSKPSRGGQARRSLTTAKTTQAQRDGAKSERLGIQTALLMSTNSSRDHDMEDEDTTITSSEEDSSCSSDDDSENEDRTNMVRSRRGLVVPSYRRSSSSSNLMLSGLARRHNSQDDPARATNFFMPHLKQNNHAAKAPLDGTRSERVGLRTCLSNNNGCDTEDKAMSASFKGVSSRRRTSEGLRAPCDGRSSSSSNLMNCSETSRRLRRSCTFHVEREEQERPSRPRRCLTDPHHLLKSKLPPQPRESITKRNSCTRSERVGLRTCLVGSDDHDGHAAMSSSCTGAYVSDRRSSSREEVHPFVSPARLARVRRVNSQSKDHLRKIGTKSKRGVRSGGSGNACADLGYGSDSAARRHSATEKRRKSLTMLLSDDDAVGFSDRQVDSNSACTTGTHAKQRDSNANNTGPLRRTSSTSNLMGNNSRARRRSRSRAPLDQDSSSSRSRGGVYGSRSERGLRSCFDENTLDQTAKPSSLRRDCGTRSERGLRSCLGDAPEAATVSLGFLLNRRQEEENNSDDDDNISISSSSCCSRRSRRVRRSLSSSSATSAFTSALYSEAQSMLTSGEQDEKEEDEDDAFLPPAVEPVTDASDDSCSVVSANADKETNDEHEEQPKKRNMKEYYKEKLHQGKNESLVDQSDLTAMRRRRAQRECESTD